MVKEVVRKFCVRLEVHMGIHKYDIDLRDVMPRGLVEICQHFGGSCATFL